MECLTRPVIALGNMDGQNRLVKISALEGNNRVIDLLSCERGNAESSGNCCPYSELEFCRVNGRLYGQSR